MAYEQETIESSDQALLGLLAHRGPLGVTDLTTAMGVTATAVRQRLTRLMENGCIVRETVATERGRPRYCYRLTERGRRQGGSNFGDLALALWKEIREIQNPEIRAGLLQRVAHTLRVMYQPHISGTTTAEKMHAVSEIFADRDVPVKVLSDGELPVLTFYACPYPQLVEQDRSICAVEKMLFSELLGENVRLTEYRMAGSPCCRFETT